MKTCDYNHLILYAKKHYKQGDIIEDIKKIVAERCLLDLELVSDNDVWQVSMDALLQHSHQHIDQFLKDLFQPMPDENDFGPLAGFEGTCPILRAVRLVLRHLYRVKVLDKDGNKILELGEPDSSILPLSENAKKKLEKETA